MSSFTVSFAGFEELSASLGQADQKKVVEAARMAVNDTARWALKEFRLDMYGRVNFPAGYLEKEDRLKVSRFASNTSLEAAIFSRSEPTSLARFALDAGSKDGIMVSVKKGNRPKRIVKGFLFGLKKGQVSKSNTGLVIRSEGKPNGTYKPKEVGPKFPNLWLVYGPSVYQVFRQSMSDYEPQTRAKLEERFNAHAKRLGLMQ